MTLKFFDQYLGYIKIALVAAVVAFTVWLMRDHYEGVIAKKDAALQAANATYLKQKNEIILKAGEQHDKDQLIINSLRDRIKRLRNVHIPVIKCGPNDSADQDGRARLLSEKIDRALGEVREGDGVDSARCDQLNIDAIRSNKINSK